MHETGDDDLSGDIIGLRLIHSSDQVCDSSATGATWSFVSEITCDPNVQEQPTKYYFSATYADCQYTVKATHAAGCPIFSFEPAKTQEEYDAKIAAVEA